MKKWMLYDPMRQRYVQHRFFNSKAAAEDARKTWGYKSWLEKWVPQYERAVSVLVEVKRLP